MVSSKKQRRVPQQARSKRRYEHILDTAAALFAVNGVDQVTTNHIAVSADISIGSIYQFFPNKEAILEGLVERYMQNAAHIFPRELDPTQVPIEQVIRRVLTGFVQFKSQQTGFETVLVGLGGTSNQGASVQMQQAVIDGIERVLAAYYPDLPRARRRLCAQVSFGLVGGIMPHDLPEATMIDEMVLAVASYQQAFLRREAA